MENDVGNYSLFSDLFSNNRNGSNFCNLFHIMMIRGGKYVGGDAINNLQPTRHCNIGLRHC